MKNPGNILIAFVSLLVLNAPLQAQSPTFEWVTQTGGTGFDFGNAITSDAEGNLYTTGTFQGAVDFDPGPGTTTLTSFGSQDIFIQKLDPDGNFEWAKQIGGTDDGFGYSISLDDNGNIYTTGFFEGTADFDPGSGTTNLTSVAGNDIFILKLAASGDFLWAKQMSGVSREEGYSITTDANEHVYATGYFEGTVDFDPGAGTANLTSLGQHDIFVQKLAASGDFVWAKQVGGADFDFGYEITTDASGNVYITGSFEGTADFDPGAGTANLTSAGEADIFIQKLDANGDFVWAKQMGDTGDDIGLSLTADTNGNLYTTGSFEGTTDFDPGTGTTNLMAVGSADMFVQKLDANGDFVWVKQMGGPSRERGSSIITDSNGNVYIAGLFLSTVDFDPGTGTSNLTSAGSSDIFVQKLAANGDFVWVAQMGGTDYDEGLSITVDANGNVYTTGYFEGTADFDPGAGITELMTAGFLGFPDIFIHKLSTTTVGLPENAFSEKFMVYPNPTTGNLSIEFDKTHESVRLRLLSLSGQVIETKNIRNMGVIQLDFNQPTGTYILELSDERGGKARSKIVIE